VIAHARFGDARAHLERRDRIARKVTRRRGGVLVAPASATCAEPGARGDRRSAMRTETAARRALRRRRIARRSRACSLVIHQEINQSADQNHRQEQAEQSAERQTSKTSEASQSSHAHVFGAASSMTPGILSKDVPSVRVGRRRALTRPRWPVHRSPAASCIPLEPRVYTCIEKPAWPDGG